MSRSLKPRDAKAVEEAVQWAVSEGKTLEIVGSGSKRAIGRPTQTDATLDLSALSGITLYEPEELVLSARAGTPLKEIETLLASRGQQLAFEPMDCGPVVSGSSGAATIGAVLATNLSGPRRIKAGAARDHFLGFHAISGRGEIFKAGGKVVKNVTGYDLPKLMAGSYGTLAALEEVTVKVLPQPETVATVLFAGLAPGAAGRLMAAALGSPHEVSGAAYLPAGTTMPLTLSIRPGTAAFRVEGPAPSVAFRRDALLHEHRESGAASTLDASGSLAFWRAIGEVAPLSALGERAVWRISVAPARGAAIGEAVARSLDAVWYLDWGGGLLWLAVAEREDAGAQVIRAAIRATIRGHDGHGTGHATLVKASPALRRGVPVFEPQPPPLAALSRRVKDA